MYVSLHLLLIPFLTSFSSLDRYDQKADVQPSPLARVVRSAAQKSKSETIDVKFYKEHF